MDCDKSISFIIRGKFKEWYTLNIEDYLASLNHLKNTEKILIKNLKKSYSNFFKLDFFWNDELVKCQIKFIGLNANENIGKMSPTDLISLCSKYEDLEHIIYSHQSFGNYWFKYNKNK